MIAGRYLPRRRLGRGAISEVLAATDLVTGQEVAVKLLRADSDTDRRRMQREGILLRRLDHPGIVKLLDADVEDGEPVVVMELVDGVLLREVLVEQVLDPGAVADMGAALADALSHAHGQGVVHRDIKPSNIVITPDGAPRLIDFGVACLAEGSAVTATGDVVGTVAYVAPEQAWQGHVTGAADVYSLGLVLIECLTGTRPFRGSLTEQIAARLAGPPPVPPGLPAELVSLLRAMTAMEADSRPSSADLVAPLAAAAAGCRERPDPPLANPAKAPRPTAGRHRRRARAAATSQLGA